MLSSIYFAKRMPFVPSGGFKKRRRPRGAPPLLLLSKSFNNFHYHGAAPNLRRIPRTYLVTSSQCRVPTPVTSANRPQPIIWSSRRDCKDWKEEHDAAIFLRWAVAKKGEKKYFQMEATIAVLNSSTRLGRSSSWMR